MLHAHERYSSNGQTDTLPLGPYKVNIERNNFIQHLKKS